MSEQTKIVVIGGSAAGPKAAAKARRLDQHASIIMVQKGPDLSMASCGYPYYVGGTFDDRNALLCTPTGVVRDPTFYLNAKGIEAKVNCEAMAIDRAAKTVTVRCLESGSEEQLPYDKLVLATGATPFIPPIDGTCLEGVSTLQSMKDADYLRSVRDEKAIDHAVIIGGGLIGIETAEALHEAGIHVTVVEMLPQILPFMDEQLAKLVERYVTSEGIDVICENPVAEILGADGKVRGVKLKNGTELDCGLVVVSVGVQPNVALARDAGLEIGEAGGLLVDEHMCTSDPDIFGCGDCCEIVNLVSGRKVRAPFGDLANLEGRVAARNMIAKDGSTFPGTIQTGVCKIIGWSVGSTGLGARSAAQHGFEDVETVVTTLLDVPGFMGAKPVISEMIVERSTRKVIGYQAVGPGEVSKRVACAAVAIQAGMTVDQVCNLDLPYAPPFSQAIDILITTAHVMQNKLDGDMKGISAAELNRRLGAGETPFLLDVRGPDEFEQMRLGKGETLIPLGALRKRLGELPEDKSTEIICYCKISLRGWEAASLLAAHGYTDVKVLEGGLVAWPYPREK